MGNNVFLAAHRSPHFCIVFRKHLRLFIPSLMKKTLLTICLLFVGCLSFGQGWERLLTGGGQDEGRAIARTPDGGYIVAGSYGSNKAVLMKVDADGFLQWSKNYLPGAGVFSASAVAVAPDSTILVAGFAKMQLFSSSDGWVMKADFKGNIIWQKMLGSSNDDEFSSLALLPDGGFAAAGFSKNGDKKQAVLARFDAAGDTLWTKTYGAPNTSEQIHALAVAANGDFLMVGDVTDIPDLDVYALRTDADGNVRWATTYGFDFVPNAFSQDAGFGILETADGGLVVAGKTTSLQGQQGGLLMKLTADGNPSPVWFKAFQNALFTDVIADETGGFFISGSKQTSLTNEDLYLLHTDEAGEKIWDRRAGKNNQDIGYALVRAADGGVVAAGYAALDFILNDTYVYLVKTTANGTIYTNYIEGEVFHDFDLDCQKDPDEPNFEDWLVKIESPDYVRYATTDANGRYSTLVDTGLYTVSLIAPNDYWQPCNSPLAVPVFAFNDTARTDLGVRAAKSCPQNVVEIRTPILRRCAENTYTVRYCNAGTIPSVDTRIEVKLDSFLTFTGSAVPFQILPGNIVSFPVGYLKNGDCRSFTFTAWLNCDSTATGQAHCVKAHVFPDTLCNSTANWDGSIVEAKADCKDQKISLKIRNAGSGPITGNLEYVVIEDQVMYRTQSPIPPLGPGKDSILFSAPANGKTYRIIADQTPGYPGISYPTAAVEGCKTDTTTSVSTGFYIMFPEDDGDVFVSTDCQESYEPSFNPPFLKRGHPKGYDVAHYVNPTTDLDFLIRFVNTSDDTVRQVIVRDTLSEWLNPATVRPGAASHPYDFQVYADGIVQFTIPNLFLLPGSSAEGFVQFRVSQKADLPCGTQIFNRAATYFDFNAPVFTNETFHTVCRYDSSLVVKTLEIFIPGAAVRVFPNPFDDSAQFEISGLTTGAKQYALELYDTQGRPIIRQFFNQPTFRLFRHQLPEGMYFYRLSADGKPVASGKITALAP